MGRKPNEWIHISKQCMKDALKNRGYTQIRLANELHKDKDNLNLQIRTERMDSALLAEISHTIRVPIEYLTGELRVKDTKDLWIYTTDRDSEGNLIPSYEETLERMSFHSVEDYVLRIGNSLLEFQQFLSEKGYTDDSPGSLKKLQLPECDYIFDELQIVKKLPDILRKIEERRKELRNEE